MIEDKDIVLFIARNQRSLLVGSILLLLFLVYLNVRLWRKRKSDEAANEIVMNWSQNLDEVEIDFPLPAGATSRDVECRILPNSIRFAFKGDERPMIEARTPANREHSSNRWRASHATDSVARSQSLCAGNSLPRCPP